MYKRKEKNINKTKVLLLMKIYHSQVNKKMELLWEIPLKIIWNIYRNCIWIWIPKRSLKNSSKLNKIKLGKKKKFHTINVLNLGQINLFNNMIKTIRL